MTHPGEHASHATVEGMTTPQMLDAMPRLLDQLSERASVTAPILGDWSRAWLAAWNGHDVAGVCALVTDDIVYEDPSILGEHIVGKQTFAEFLRMFWRAFPDAEFGISATPYLALIGTGVAIPWRVTATHTGDMAGGPSPLALAPTGRRVDIQGVDLYTFREGLLNHWTSVVDLLELTRQLGLTPPARSRALHLAVTTQRLISPLLRRTTRR